MSRTVQSPPSTQDLAVWEPKIQTEMCEEEWYILPFFTQWVWCHWSGKCQSASPFVYPDSSNHFKTKHLSRVPSGDRRIQCVIHCSKVIIDLSSGKAKKTTTFGHKLVIYDKLSHKAVVNVSNICTHSYFNIRSCWQLSTKSLGSISHDLKWVSDVGTILEPDIVEWLHQL